MKIRNLNKNLFFIILGFFSILTLTNIALQTLGYYNLKVIIIIICIISIILYLILSKFISKLNSDNLFLIEQNEEMFISLERYDIAAKATSDTIRDWNLITNNLEWNNGIVNVFGYTEKDQENNLDWWFSKIHPQDSLKMSVKLYSFIEQKTGKWQDYYRFLCADGTYKYVFDRGFMVFDEDNNVVRMIGAVQDVSKQKEEEQQLKLLETVITETKDTIIISEVDNINQKHLKTVYVNPAFKTMTGYENSKILNKSPASFLRKKYYNLYIEELLNLVKKKEDFIFEGKNIKKNNDEYWFNLSMLPIKNANDETTHWITVKRDITLEKIRELEREQLIKELTQNNIDLKQFSYITSHNLRAPLSNLSGLLNLIEDIKIEDEELAEIIDGFSKSTYLLNETINDLVKILVIKDNTSIETENINIQTIFENVKHQISFKINTSKAEFILDIENAPTIKFNKTYFESILQNLMTNSIKYCAANRNPIIEIKTFKKEKEIILIFKDNGIGIDMKKNKEKVFGLYQRFHDYPDSKGLGLYLVKSQMESMGGKIEIESEVNKGTSFILTFKNN
jgi:PAS domain S-box-containing protein